MYTLEIDARDRFGAYGTLDIETDGFDGKTNELVAIGVGYYEASGSPDLEVFTRRQFADEAALIGAAFEWLTARHPEGVVTYNGLEFDFAFLDAKLEALGVDPGPSPPSPHVDLFAPRRRLADRAGTKWPSLEECLRAYDLPVAETAWEGEPLTNARFGEDLAPRYITAIETGEATRAAAIDRTIDAYTAADIEATIALYEADVNRGYDPRYSGP